LHVEQFWWGRLHSDQQIGIASLLVFEMSCRSLSPKALSAPGPPAAKTIRPFCFANKPPGLQRAEHGICLIRQWVYLSKSIPHLDRF
jgi:hypothetical protein